MRKNMPIFLIVGVVIAVILTIKVIIFFTAEPKVTIDYVTEYNRITLPANYDPNDNAASYYQKAFDVFVEMPRELWDVPYIMGWPTDLNSTKLAKLEEWLASNSQAFEYFKIAAEKPLYWFEMHAQKDNVMMTITFPELSPIRQLTKTLMWNAKLEASKGRLQIAFENIIDCYRAGRQKCRTPSFLIEQKVGLDIKQDAVLIAMVILDRTQINNTILESFQDALYEELNRDTYVPDMQAEKLMLYDILQRSFVDNDKGTGRLYWRASKTFPGSSLLFGGWSWYEWDGPWYNACPFLFGPTKNEMVEQIEQLFRLFEPLKTQTPWQLHNQGYSFAKIDEICLNNFFLRMLGPDPRRPFYQHYEIKSRTEAVIAVAAILRFKADNNRLPASLDELVSTGYLKSVPMDPYSDGLLVYKITEDGFKLYSVGEDFVDDDGATNVKTEGNTRRDILFWPVKRYEQRLKTCVAEPNKTP